MLLYNVTNYLIKRDTLSSKNGKARCKNDLMEAYNDEEDSGHNIGFDDSQYGFR